MQTLKKVVRSFFSTKKKKKRTKMVQWRARSVSFFGTFLVLPMVLWSQPGKLAGVYFMTALALKEYHSLTASNPSLLSHTFQALSCLALIAASWFADYFSFCLVSFGVLSVHAAAWLVCLSDLNECHLHWLLGAAPATAVKSSQEHEQHETQLVTLQHLAAMLVSLAGLMIPFSFLHCMCLYRGQQSSMIPVWYTILVVTAADVGGLLGGHFGRALLKTSSTSPTLNCITPSISPSKSLSGLLLALLLPPLSSVMLFCLLQLFAYDECASVGDTPIKVSLGYG